jgi:hypothetical protein
MTTKENPFSKVNWQAGDRKEKLSERWIEAKMRLKDIRESINSESISYGELTELAGLAKQGYVDKDDAQLLEWAGIPESKYRKGLSK